MKRAHRFVVLALVAACGSPDAPILSDPLNLGPAFEVQGRVRLVASAENPVGLVSAIARTSDGFALADQMASDIKIFDESGTLVRTVGQPGDGPGELRNPIALVALAGDTLLVVDQRGRVSTFRSAGVFLARWQAPVRPVFGMQVEANAGSVLLAGSITPTPGIPDTATTFEVHRFTRDGEHLGSFVEQEPPRFRAEQSFMGTPIALSGDVLTVGRFGRNDLRHVELRTDRSWRSVTGDGIYRTPDWPRAKGRTIEDAVRFAEPYAWMERIIAGACGVQLVVFQRMVGNRRDFQYVVHRKGPGDVARTARTELAVTGGSATSELYATLVDASGEVHLITLALEERLRVC